MPLDFTPDTQQQQQQPQVDFKPDQPVPQLPDTNGIQSTVRTNLAAPQDDATEGQAPQPQSSSQRLDTGLGMPVSAALKGGDANTPLPADLRAHLMNSYAAGTSQNAGDFMQTALPAAANASNPGSESLNVALQRTGRDVMNAAGMVAGFIPDSIARLMYTGAQQAGLIDKDIPVNEIGGQSVPSVTEAVNNLSKVVFPQGASQTKLDSLVDQAATMTASLAITGPASLATTAWRSIYLSAAGIFGSQAQQAVANWARNTFPNQPFVQESITQAANLGVMGGIAGAGHVAEPIIPGHEILKPIVAEATGKTPESVTPQDINNTIMQGFKDRAPAAQDFHDVATVMDATAQQEQITSVDHTQHTPEDFRSFAQDYEPTIVGSHEAAKNFVVERGAQDGKEHSVAIDNETGLAKNSTHSVAENTVSQDPELLENPNNNITVHHNHPGNSPLSNGDINNLAYPGLNTVVAHGDDGSFSSASLTKTMADKLRNRSIAVGRVDLDIILDKAKKTAFPLFADLVKKNQLIPDTAAKIMQETINRALAKKGVINYTSSIPFDEDKYGDLQRQIEDALEKPLRITGYNNDTNTLAPGISISVRPGEGTKSVFGQTTKNQNERSGFQGGTPGGLAGEGNTTNTRTSLQGLASLLRQIYRETGIRPDRVFQDAKDNPSVAADIAAGRVPEVYAELKEQKPPTILSTEGASTSNNPLEKIFNPAGMSDSARDMATALRQGRGPGAQDVAQIQDAMQRYSKDFGQMNDNARLAFIDYLENRTKGANNPFPELQGAADKIRDIYAQMGQKMQEQFPDVGLREDYFTHQYDDPAAAKKFFDNWVAKQGSQRNLQERAFPTLSEAMEAGLKPKTTNPIETVMRYVTNMNNLLSAHRSVELAQEYGVADYFKNGEQPTGWVPLKGNLANKDGMILYAPEDAARVYNNDISERASGPAGDILDTVQRANNFFSKLVLGFSGYHFTAETFASMASDVARGAYLKAVTPLANLREGKNLINGYLGQEELPPELQQALDLAVKNNTINIKQQDYWKSTAAKDYFDVFKTGTFGQELKAAGETLKEHPITGSVRILANEVGRTMETMAKPLFDYYIPRLKISANINELHDWLQKHPEATPQEQDFAAQNIGNSIDNRFGEMMRDNLFWHQLTRQTLQTALLSYSWVTGGLRMLKGIPDIGQTILGKTGLFSPKELTPNARYLLGMAATYAVANGVLTYIHTGKPPDPSDWKDFVYYKTGGKTPQDQPERGLLPSHISQFTHYLSDGIGELGNEASPLLKMIYHLVTNKDFRGLPITNDNNKWYDEQKWGDYLKYALHESEPIALKNFLEGNKKGSEITNEEKLLGVRQAPRFITDPKGYDAMMKRVNDEEYQRKLRSDAKLKAQSK